MAPDDPIARIRLLRDAFAVCFNVNTLQEFVTLELSQLDPHFRHGVHFEQEYAAVCFDLADKARELGLCSEVARAVVTARPKHDAAKALVVPFGLPTLLGSSPLDPALRDAVLLFNDRFKARRLRLDKLKRLKGLHDILHQLQSAQTDLVRFLGAAANAPFDPLSDTSDLTDRLETWKAEADSFAPPTDRPDLRRKWVAAFSRTLSLVSDRLKGNAVPQAEIDRALAYLDYLPNEQQPDLNEKLRETASELDTVGLAEPLGAIRAILPPKDAAEWDEKFNRFDGDCRALKSLIDQHDFCTIVDGALREADGLPGATAGALSQWADAVQCLGGLATGRPAHKATQRLVESATRFAAADAADSGRLFEALRGRFVNVFFEIDSELLDATVRVITSAELLDTLLGRYR